MSGLLVNEVFIYRFFKNYGGADGSTSGVDPSITGISVACLQAAAAVGALIAGRLGDMIGRKKCVRIGAFIYFFSSFIQMFAPGFATFIAGRTIQGVGVGFLSMTVPIIQTEIAAPHRRGLMVGIEYTFLIAGYMLSCWVDYGFNFLLPNHISWQGPFIIQVVLSFVLCGMSFFLPETPRWLAMNGFVDESLQTIADLHSDGNTEAELVQRTFLEIQEAVIYENNLGKSDWKVTLPCFLCGLSISWITDPGSPLYRKCSPGIVNELLSESRCRCSRRSTESTSSPSTFRAPFQPPAMIVANPCCSLLQMPFPTPLQQLLPGG
jgi:MFS family permease